MAYRSELKPGVDAKGLKPEILLAIMIAETVCHGMGHNFTITSLLDGTHSPKSFHYKGLAVDIRTREMNQTARKEFRRLLANALGDQYDVVLESTHMHVEFDPD